MPKLQRPAPNDMGEGLRRTLKILTPKEVATMLEVSQGTVDLWRKDRVGPQYTRLGRRVYYLEEDLQIWFQQNIGRERGDYAEEDEEATAA